MERLTREQIEEILDRGGAVNNNPGDGQPWYRNEPGGPLQITGGAAEAGIEGLVGYCVVEAPRPAEAPPFRASLKLLSADEIDEILNRGGAVDLEGADGRNPWYRNEPGGPIYLFGELVPGETAGSLVGVELKEVPRPTHAPPFRETPPLSEDEINEILNRGGAVNYEGDDSPWYRKEPNGDIFFRAATGGLRKEGIHALTGLHIMEVPRPEDAPPFRASPARSATDRQVGGSHYQMPIQPAEYLYANREQIDYISGRAITYLSRWRRKNGVEDLDKAIHCIELVKELHAKEDK